VISVVVADDHEVVRAGFAALLDTQPDFTVLGTASDGAQAVAVCLSLRPDVVLMDIRMPGTDGIEATQRLTAAEHPPKVLILTTFDLDEYVFDALRAGASGFLLKDVTAERLFEAVRVVAAGEALLAPAVTRRLISEFARLRPQPGAGTPGAAARPGALAALTPRETEVLRLVAEGLSNTEIAGRLVVTEETVKTHVSRILSKLALRDRTQAVVVAYESGLVVPGRLADVSSRTMPRQAVPARATIRRRRSSAARLFRQTMQRPIMPTCALRLKRSGPDRGIANYWAIVTQLVTQRP
jgi:DNA-binding NarL/FixJ family response regulator